MGNFYDFGFRNVDGMDINRFNRLFTLERFRAVGRTPRVFSDLAEARRDYGIITCLHVLEHVPDPPATLAVLKSSLRPGGLFLGLAPFSLVGNDFPEHRVEWKDLKLTDLAASVGLTVLGVAPFGGINGYAFELVVARRP